MMRWVVTMRLTCLATWLAMASGVAVAAEPKLVWKTGTPLEERLATPLDGGIQWTGRALRDGLRTLSRQEAVRVAIVLDRRIDPGQPMTDKLDAAASLAAALDQLAAKFQAGVGRVGPVVYIGPPSTTQRVRTVAELRRDDAKQTPAAVRRRLERVAVWRWDDLAAPRSLLEELAAEAQIDIVNLDALPHDLWAGSDLPPMTWSDRVSLILAGYDLTYELPSVKEGAKVQLRLVPFPKQPVLTRSYPATANVDALAERLRAKVPQAKVEVQEKKLTVAGRAEDHQLVADELRGKPAGKTAKTAPKVPLDRLRSSVQAKNQPVGKLLAQYADQIHLDLQLDQAAITAAGISLDTLVTVELENAKVPEVLTAMTKPAGLTFEIKGKTLAIRPAKKP